METLLVKLFTGAVEAVLVGSATGGVLALVRKVQMLLGVKGEKDRGVGISGVH
jgi:hypothetical protein